MGVSATVGGLGATWILCAQPALNRLRQQMIEPIHFKTREGLFTVSVRWRWLD